MRRARFIVLLAVVVGIGLLHFFTPGHSSFLHDTYRRLSYFPIVLGGLWFGLAGGLTMAFCSSIAFIPHLLLYAGHAPQAWLSELTEILLYLAAGAVTGSIAGREAGLRRRHEEIAVQLEKSYRRLERQAKMLLEAEEQLGASQRLSALGRLSASLAHEIKNPLSSIRGTAEIFRDEFPEGHPKREFVDILLRETDRLNRTVSDVMRFSRGGTAAGRRLEPLNGVLVRVVQLVDGQLRNKRIELHPADFSAAADVQVDGDRISQVFLNILLNAVDALKEGGRIELGVAVDAREARVSVCDNGPGIPAAERESIFTPFVTSKEVGTGLGLPISRKIVESYGGKLFCTEADGGGACFTVVLPVGDGEPGPGDISETKGESDGPTHPAH
ncbi:MAG: HAMP domain-containing sensor histidine kinase [Thermodesulfobacteriota bacterium]